MTLRSTWEPGPRTLFLIDIQADQVAGLGQFLRERTGHAPRVIPVLRARITQVRGKDVTLENLEEVRGRGSLAREYTVTYRPSIEANERVVAGRFWDATPSSTAGDFDRGGHPASASRSTSATTCGSTCWASRLSRA